MMSLPLLIQGLGSIGLFASRAFLPAFTIAALLRFGPQVSWIADTGLLQHVSDVPTWFTSNPSLIVLGLMSLLELLAERVPEAKAILDQVHDYLKVGMAALTYVGVVGATDRAAVGGLIGETGALQFLPALAVGAGTFATTRVRGAIVSPLTEADEDDDLGLQGILVLVGDAWALLGPLALVLLPLLSVAFFGIAAVLFLLVERWVQSRAARSNVACTSCGQSMHAGAIACPNCRTTNPEPRAVGILGNVRGPATSLDRQRLALAAVKRCSVCASRFARRAIPQDCSACGFRLGANPLFAREFVAYLDRRVPLVCVACFVLGLVPILGVIPGVILYRLALVAPLRRYIPPGPGALLRWGIQVALIALVALQWVPLAGAFTLPAMALIHYGATRTVFLKVSATS